MKIRKLMKSKYFYNVMIVVVAVSVIFTSVTAYVRSLNQRISDTTIQSLMEIAQHDATSIQSFLNTNWNRLTYVGETIRLGNCSDMKEVMDILAQKSKFSEYECISAIDSDGNIYNSDYSINTINDDEYSKLLDWSINGKSVLRMDGIMSDSSDALVYSARIVPVRVGSKKIVSIIARTSLNSIEGDLRIESFEGRGYSVVFNKQGNMVVNINLKENLGERENFYKQLGESKIEGGYTVDDIIKLNEKNTSYIVHYTDAGGTRKVFYACPIENTQWTFVIIVPNEVLVEQSHDLEVMIIILISCVSVLLIGVMIAIFASLRRSMKVKADADAKSTFLSNMSHEIRTPLNGIVGLNQLMMSHIDDTEKMKEYLAKNTTTAQYLLSLVNDILDVSKLQANKFEIDCRPFSIPELIESICQMHKSTFDNKNITFTVEPHITKPYIEGDHMRVKQVLMNILSNAAKFTPNGGKVSLTVEQLVATDDIVETIFTISDTGCGMSKEFQNKIFDSFSQERNQNPESIKGTGLGMTISYLLMKQMGGSITVDSTLGKGSTFVVKLFADVCQKPIESEAVTVKKPHSDRSISVLLVEDNTLNAEVLTEILTDEGVKVDYAENGQAAVEKFNNSKPNEYDAILMDIQMPIMDGYEACKAIRALSREDAQSVIIYACTANAFKEDERRALEAGMNDFLTKPINVQELFSKLNPEI